MKKKNIAIYTATGCRACECAFQELHYQVSPLNRTSEISFWPFVLGSRWQDMDPAEKVDVCWFSGAIQTEEDREAAQRLREKSEIMIAVGACAAFGGLPGLANLRSGNTGDEASPADTVPELTLPRLESKVSALSRFVPVDYFVPGCPVPQNLLWAAFQAFISGTDTRARLSFAASRLPEPIAQAIASGVAPPEKSTFAGEKAVCASCSRQKEEKRFQESKRAYDAYEESGRCLLEQGLICMGISTREGCGGLCTGIGIPCRGCFGKAEAIFDPGSKMVSAISSTFDTQDPAEIQKITDNFIDLVGTFYRYTLPSQCLMLSD